MNDALDYHKYTNMLLMNPQISNQTMQTNSLIDGFFHNHPTWERVPVSSPNISFGALVHRKLTHIQTHEFPLFFCTFHPPHTTYVTLESIEFNHLNEFQAFFFLYVSYLAIIVKRKKKFNWTTRLIVTFNISNSIF